MPQTKPNLYYRDRAIVRKIMREGTGLDAERTPDEELWNLASTRLAMLRAFFEQMDSSNVPVARAIVELDEIYSQLMVRGVQMRFVFPADDLAGLGRDDRPEITGPGDGPAVD